MKIARNEPCPCGSGKKYKKCCEPAQRESARSTPRIPAPSINSQLHAAEHLFAASQHAKAAELCTQILGLYPNHTGALRLLGRLQLRGGDIRKAMASFKSVLKISPNDIQSLYFYGRALGESGRFTEAIPYLEKTIEVDPKFAEGYNFLGTLLHVMGKTDEGAELTLKAVQLDQDNSQLHSHQLVSAHSSSRYSADDLFKFHKEWARRHASPFYTEGPLSISPDPLRRIRLGYVSPRFNRDIVGYFFKSVLDHHSREDFETFCYSNTRAQDDYTTYFTKHSNWREIAGLNDEQVANTIRQDQIDILVDLSGHTPNNRLLVFARKPAPIQVTWLDYFNTTGLETMDYLITDPVSTPTDGSQKFVEKLARLPHTRFCWTPPEFAPDIKEPPVMTQGIITFGSFNRPEKITGHVINIWASILRNTPNSRLLLKNRNFNFEDTRKHFLQEFQNNGVAPDRIEMRGESPHDQLLREYGDVDIALDPFPYNGGATTCDALLMGVPVITLEGHHMIGRQTASILSSVGLTNFIAKDEASYIRMAVKWSSDIDQLAEIRKQLRLQFTSSRVCNSRIFTQDLERIYREIWGRWCADHNDAHTSPDSDGNS